MSLGSVSVNNLDLSQGTPDAVECLNLFAGTCQGAKEKDTVQAINMKTDLDDLLGATDSSLKTQILAARANAGQNWFAYTMPLTSATGWLDKVDSAVAETSVESIVATDPASAKADLEAMHAKAGELISKYQRRTFFQACITGPSEQSWADYVTAAKAITANVSADRVLVTPLLYPDFQGAIAGRLANKAVSIADSPMRVATGTLIGSYADKPEDQASKPLDKSILLDLHDNGRFTVPTWYEDYDGTFTSDGYTLAAETSDYRVIENLRVTDKAARRIYLLAVARIANRLLNSTPASVAMNKTYFMKPLREMAHSTEINGITFPGDITQPLDTDIEISWPTKYSVEIYFVIRPYNSPKEITCNITLDLTNAALQPAA